MRQSVRTAFCEMVGYSRIAIGINSVLLLLLLLSAPSALFGDGPTVIWALGLTVVLTTLSLSIVALVEC